jgi:bacillaene synthase trans-acting acyltransferase
MSFARTVFVFSGQGSHYYRMGQPLHDADPLFREHLHRLDALAVERCGVSVLQATFEGRKDDAFDRTLLTHPAIFMLEQALALRLVAGGIRPDVVLGASLGTFAAATQAGCMDEATAMTAVVAQARAFEATCPRGGIIAILDSPSLYEQEPFLHEASELAALNFDAHFGVAAPQAALDAIEAELKRRGIVHQRLAVSFAFHSRWIDPARDTYLDAIRGLTLREGAVPIACCDRATTDVRSLVHQDLWDAPRLPIRFFDTIARLESEGPCRYIDVGPSGTMATFLKYALPRGSASTVHAVLTPYGHDVRNLDTLLAASR